MLTSHYGAPHDTPHSCDALLSGNYFYLMQANCSVNCCEIKADAHRMQANSEVAKLSREALVLHTGLRVLMPVWLAAAHYQLSGTDRCVRCEQ